jgi:hypothetical protein
MLAESIPVSTTPFSVLPGFQHLIRTMPARNQ